MIGFCPPSCWFYTNQTSPLISATHCSVQFVRRHIWFGCDPGYPLRALVCLRLEIRKCSDWLGDRGCSPNYSELLVYSWLQSVSVSDPFSWLEMS